MRKFRHISTAAAPALFVATDQGVFSAGNFVIFVLLARWMEIAEFGYFVAIQTSFFLSIMIYGALIVEPMAVYFSSQYKTEQAAYASEVLKLHFLIAPLIALPSLAVLALLLEGRQLVQFDVAASVIAVTPLLLAVWFLRRWAYNIGAAYLAAGFSLVNATFSLASLFFLASVGWLSAVTALWALALGAAACLICGLPLLSARRRKSVTSSPELSEVARVHWRFGRWVLVGQLVHYGNQQLPLIMLTRAQGLEAAAEFRALLTLALPISLLLTSAAAYVVPVVAASFAQGCEDRGKRVAYSLQAAFFFGAVGLVIALALGSGWLIHSVYGSKFIGVAFLGPLLAGMVAVDALRLAPSVIMRAAHWPKFMGVVPALTMPVTLVATYVMVQPLGTAGAMYACLIISAASTVFTYVTYLYWWRGPRRGTGGRGVGGCQA